MSFRDPDEISATKTSSKSIYDVGWGELFFRNFVAGMARTLGSLFLYGLVIFLVANFFMQQIWPQIEPALSGYSESMQLLQQMYGL